MGADSEAGSSPAIAHLVSLAALTAQCPDVHGVGKAKQQPCTLGGHGRTCTTSTNSDTIRTESPDSGVSTIGSNSGFMGLSVMRVCCQE